MANRRKAYQVHFAVGFGSNPYSVFSNVDVEIDYQQRQVELFEDRKGSVELIATGPLDLALIRWVGPAQ